MAVDVTSAIPVDLIYIAMLRWPPTLEEALDALLGLAASL